MKRTIEFHIGVSKTQKKKGYVSVGDEEALNNDEAVPKKLQLWIWWDPQDDKIAKYNVPENGVCRVVHPKPYSEQLSFDLLFRLSALSKGDRKRTVLSSPYDQTVSMTSSEISTASEVGNLTIWLRQIKATHRSFLRPPILAGLPHSRLVSIILNTAQDVEVISRYMDQFNAKAPNEPLFEIVSVTHMGYAWASQSSFDKQIYYTVFYRMIRPLNAL